MFAQSLAKCQKSLEEDGMRAVEALTVSTAAYIGDKRELVVLDANEQQKIEEFWVRNMPILWAKAYAELGDLRS